MKEALSYKLWYAATTTNTSGSSMKIHARKQMASTGYHLVQIENFDPSVTNTFKLVIAGTPTADITVPTYATAGSAAIGTSVNASVKSAVEAVAGSTVSVSPPRPTSAICRSTSRAAPAPTWHRHGQHRWMRPKYCGRPRHRACTPSRRAGRVWHDRLAGHHRRRPAGIDGHRGVRAVDRVQRLTRLRHRRHSQLLERQTPPRPCCCSSTA